MLPLVVSFAIAVSPARGLHAGSPLELVKQVDQRLDEWLSHGGDWKELLATEEELDAAFADSRTHNADVATILADRWGRPSTSSFTATRALVTTATRFTEIRYYDSSNLFCSVTFAALTPGYYLLLDGPLVDRGEFPEDTEQPGFHAFLKRGSAWSVAPPPKLDCNARLLRAARRLYAAEQSFFAEAEHYTDDLKLLRTVANLDATKVSVELTGAGQEATFTATLTQQHGEVRVDSMGEIKTVKACAK